MTGPDLTDREVALALRKHVRTVQRWCASGRLADAYKAGRAWRIPAASLEAVAGHEFERLRSGLEAAVTACERLRADANAAAQARRRWGETPTSRDWTAVTADIAAIEQALAGVRREVSTYR